MSPKSSYLSRAYSLHIADLLFSIGAHTIEPTVLASGMLSPIYIDCRKLISHVNARNEIIKIWGDGLRQRIIEKNMKVDYLAGGESAGIPFASFLANYLNLPMLYVRKAPKAHGKSKLIEGDFKHNSNVLLIEDLTSSGHSKLHFIDCLQSCGLNYLECSSLVYYNISELAHQINHLSFLCSLKDICKVIANKSHLPSEKIDQILAFSKPI